jgi:hypothetical protein
MTSPLDFIKTYGIYALAAALAAALVWGSIERVRAAGYKADVAVVRQQHSDAVAKANKLALEASEANRKEEARLQREKQEAVNHAKAQTKMAEDAAARAAAESVGLRADVARYRAAARRAAADAAAGGRVTTGTDPLDLLADMFGRADDLAGQYAKEADRSRIAGLSCERQYDSLTGAQK